jgi:hypothetical protein
LPSIKKIGRLSVHTAEYQTGSGPFHFERNTYVPAGHHSLGVDRVGPVAGPVQSNKGHPLSGASKPSKPALTTIDVHRPSRISRNS